MNFWMETVLFQDLALRSITVFTSQYSDRHDSALQNCRVNYSNFEITIKLVAIFRHKFHALKRYSATWSLELFRIKGLGSTGFRSSAPRNCRKRPSNEIRNLYTRYFLFSYVLPALNRMEIKWGYRYYALWACNLPSKSKVRERERERDQIMNYIKYSNFESLLRQI